MGWNHGDRPVTIPGDGLVYIMDLSPDQPLGIVFAEYSEHGSLPGRIVWIDHHKSAIENIDDSHLLPGYRIDGVAACRLAWQWFRMKGTYAFDSASAFPAGSLPSKAQYIDRQVEEPLAVRLAGEYDVWDKRDPRAETFQYGMRVVDLNPARWNGLLQMDALEGRTVTDILGAGNYPQVYARRMGEVTVRYNSWLMDWEGLKFLCLNAYPINSLTFAGRDVPETGHDALLSFRWTGRRWMVSLYHARHRTDLDLSVIAVRHGGGGHRGACGFTCGELPFKL